MGGWSSALGPPIAADGLRAIVMGWQRILWNGHPLCLDVLLLTPDKPPEAPEWDSE